MKLLTMVLTLVIAHSLDIVTCLETVSVVTDGTINVLPNDQDVRLRCDFNVSLRTALRVRWYNDRDIVAHYEVNILDVGANYRSFVKPVGNLTLDDASISLNVTALLEKHNVTQVTYKCLVHIFDGNSSQTSAKNTTILITGDNSTSACSCDDELVLIEKRRLAVDTLRLNVERERLAVEQGRLTLERERFEFERDRHCNP